MAREDHLIIEAQGTTECIGRCPSIETRHGIAKYRDHFEETAYTLAEHYPQPNGTDEFEKCLHAQRLPIDRRDCMQHFQLQCDDHRQIGHGQGARSYPSGCTGIRQNMGLRLAKMQAFQLPRQGWELP